jgi:hypothetical protein
VFVYTDANPAQVGVTTFNRRAISVIIQLTDPAEYDGGELEVANLKASSAIGTAVLYPSYMVHKVHKVARGTRRELVAWFQLEEFDDTYKERQPADWAAGLNATEHVIAENPAHSSAHRALGKLQWAANNTVEAEKSLRTAISLDPLSSRALSDLGVMYMQKQDDTNGGHRTVTKEDFVAFLNEHDPTYVEMVDKILGDFTDEGSGFLAVDELMEMAFGKFNQVPVMTPCTR